MNSFRSCAAAVSALVVLVAADGAFAANARQFVLAERGRPPACRLVLPDDPTPTEKRAAEELECYTRALVGVGYGGGAARAVVVERGAADLGEDGFRLYVKGNALHIAGGRRGVLYGAYEVLERFGGVRWYSSRRTVIPKIDALSVPADLDITEKPAFMMREALWFDAFDPDFATHLRLNGSRVRYRAEHGGVTHRFGNGLGNCHTFASLLPPSIYGKAHPEYFAMYGGKRVVDGPPQRTTQLCLTNPDVLRIVTSNVLDRIRKDPHAKYYGVSQNDNPHHCECEKCAAVDAEEGSPAGTVVRFVNAVAEAVEKEFPDKIVETLAYSYSRKPPKKTKVRRNVMVCLCTSGCDRLHTIRAGMHPGNVSFRDDIVKWAAQTKYMYLWDYTTDFVHFPSVYPNFGVLQDDIRFFLEHGVTSLFSQGCHVGRHADFDALKLWLVSKWMWNPNLPAEPLLDDFFVGYYGAGASAARRYFDLVQSVKVPDSSNGKAKIDVKKLFDAKFVAKARSIWDEAEAATRDGDDEQAARNVRAGAFSVDYMRFRQIDGAAFRAYGKSPPTRTAEDNAVIAEMIPLARRMWDFIVAEPETVLSITPHVNEGFKDEVAAAARMAPPERARLAKVRGNVVLSDRDSSVYFEVKRDGTVFRFREHPLREGKPDVFEEELFKIKSGGFGWSWREGYLPVLRIGATAELFAYGDVLYVRRGHFLDGDEYTTWPGGAKTTREAFLSARAKVVSRWKMWFARGLQLPDLDPRSDVAWRASLVQALCAFAGRHPSYGAGYYRSFVHDSFPPNVLTACDALVQFRHADEAADILLYYLGRYVRADGTIDYFGPSLAEYGGLMRTAALVAAHEPSRAAEIAARLRPLAKAVLLNFDYLRPNTSALGPNLILSGVPEADTRDTSDEYFHNNFQVLDGLGAAARLYASQGEREFSAELAKFASMLERLVRKAYAEKRKALGGVPYSTSQKALFDDIQKDFHLTYANYRYYPEMLETGFLSPEDAEALCSYREKHNGEWNGLCFFTHPSGTPETDNWPIAAYARGLLRYGMTNRFDTLLAAQLDNYLSDDVFTAYEQIRNEGDPRTPGAPACVPAQLVYPRMLAWKQGYGLDDAPGASLAGVVKLETSAATAEVALFGARVLSFRQRGGQDVLWRPKTWRLDGGKWAHGGIPPCWPWFGSSGPSQSAMHGFAYKSKFTIRSRKSTAERSELVLGLKSSAETRKLWPYYFDLEIKFVLTDSLRMEMKTTNTGGGPFMLTCGFHPYFAIGERDEAQVTATDGMRYCDSRATTEYVGIWNGNMKLKSSFDHVFVEPKSTAFHAIEDPIMGRRIGIKSSGAARLVVWNPGAETPASVDPAPGALASGDWRRLVCVEPAILWKEAARKVEPGKSHVLAAEISCSPYGK